MANISIRYVGADDLGSGDQGLKDSHDSSNPEPISFKIPGLKKVLGKAVQQAKAAVDVKPSAAAQKVDQ